MGRGNWMGKKGEENLPTILGMSTFTPTSSIHHSYKCLISEEHAYKINDDIIMESTYSVENTNNQQKVLSSILGHFLRKC